MTRKQENNHWLDCTRCGMNSREVDEGVVSFTCWRCTQKAVGAPIEKKTRDDTKPRKQRGWQWKSEYVDSDGNVFYKGVEQPELKGTVEATPIKVLVKKHQTFQERLVEQEKRQLKLVKQRKERK